MKRRLLFTHTAITLCLLLLQIFGIIATPNIFQQELKDGPNIGKYYFVMAEETLNFVVMTIALIIMRLRIRYPEFYTMNVFTNP